MILKQWMYGACLVGVALGGTGCAWQSPFSAKEPTAAEVLSQDPTQRSLASKQNALVTSFKNAGKAITPQPKVIPAPDPLALSTKTRKIGPDLHISAAKQLEFQGQHQKAEDHYRQALALAPGNAEIQISLARLLHRQGKIDESIRVYNAILAAQPQHAVAANDLGLCLARHGQLAGSVAALSRAAELKPQSKLYRNNLATVLVECGRTDEAFQHLYAAHGEAAAHYNLGILLGQRGQQALASQHFARAAQLDASLPIPAAMAAAPSGNPAGSEYSVAQRPAKVPEENAAAPNEYRVGDASSSPAPYRLPQADPNGGYGGAYSQGPSVLPPVRYE